MNRLAVLIPVLVIPVLVAVFFFVLPPWRDRFENPGTLPPANDLPPPPTANIEGELEHHFGTIVYTGRQALTHTFTIRNADDRTFEVSIDATSCHCIVGELPKDTLAPGESMDIEVTLTIGKPGPTVQKVYLNASGALVTLTMKGIVEEGVEPVVEEGSGS